MTREDIEQAVHAGVVAASGRSLSQAVRVISDSIEAQMSAEPRFIVADETKPASIAEIPSPIMSASEARLQDLAPIRPQAVATGKPTTYREYNTIESLQASLVNTPETIEVLPSGYAEPLELRRIITTMATEPGGLQLAYKVPGADSGVAYPKEFFWVTDEHVDVASALWKIKSDALLMYARRTKPIEQRVVTMLPLESRMIKAGDVS